MKKKLLIVVSLSSIFLIIIFFQFSFFNNEYTNYQNTILEKPNDNLNSKLKTSDYSSAHQGTGIDLNITLQQSLRNNSVIEFSNLDNSNIFSEPFPEFNGYNTSYINISISAIYAPNYTYIVEDDPFEASSDLAAIYTTSFTVNSSCYITNASFNLFTESGTPTANVYLFNSTWVGSQSQPNIASAQIIGSFSSPPNGWNDVSLTKTLLSNTLTDNNTWFIGLRENTGLAVLRWRYVTDATNGDNSYAYAIGVGSLTNDYECKVGLSPLNQNSLPSDIGLRINNTLVSDSAQGSGTWSSTTQYTSQTNELEFSLTSDWWNVSCNITSVQINYTKTDLKANSNFDILSSGQNVQWNVTVPGGLNYFDSRIAGFNTINFTIPERWIDTTIKVFNGTTEETDLIKRLLGNGYREVQVLNAGNGTNWYLTANSTNLLSSIDSYVGGISIDIVNYSNIVDFNASFSTLVNNGKINLSIYNPQKINNKLNFSRELTIFNPNIEIDLGNWDIANNVTQYGNFRVIVFWNNDTAAGLLEKQITVLGETELTITQPSQNSIFDSNEIFNITINFKDIGQDVGIENAIIEYKIIGGVWTKEDVVELTNGEYNITIDCSNPLFDGYGDFSIQINVSKSFYINQTTPFNFKVLGKTFVTLIKNPDKALYNSGDSLNITNYFNDTIKNQGISGASLVVLINGADYSTPIFDYGNGYYNISIDFSDTEFVGYGSFSIRIDTNLTNYYNSTDFLSISVLGETSVSVTQMPDLATYDSGDQLNISVYYEDTVRSIGISGASISVQVDGSEYSTTIFDYGTGYYNISLDFSDTEFSGYGVFSIRIDTNLTNYYNSTDFLSISVLGETWVSVTQMPDLSFYDSGDQLNISVYYEDIVRSIGISGASISIQVDGFEYITTIFDYGNGYYNISIDFSDTEFAGYGSFSIRIDTNLTNYYNSTDFLSISALGETSVSVTKMPDLLSYDSGDQLNISVYYEDIVRSIGISGASISIQVDGFEYITTIFDYGNGYYNITIDFTDSQFSGYGVFSIRIDTNLTNYYNSTDFLSISVLGETSVSVTQMPDLSSYDSGDQLNISIYYEDIVRSIGISGASISIQVDGFEYITTIFDYGNGYYNITIDFTKSQFSGYGVFSIRIDTNLTNYYNSTDFLSISVLGETSVSVTQMPDLSSYDSGDQLNISVYYEDIVRSIGISGASISVQVDGSEYTTTIFDYGNGYYNISINFSDTEFAGYGSFSIRIDTNLTNYYNSTDFLSISVLGETSVSVTQMPDLSSYDSGDQLNISIYYEDIVRSIGISGASISIQVDGFEYITTIFDYGNGYYNISIDFSDTEFAGYGSFSIRIDTNLTNYYNSTDFLSISVLGETWVSVTKMPDLATYDSGDQLNISVYYEDIVRSIGISGASIAIQVDGSEYTTTIFDYGNGYYNITIDFTDSQFSGYGVFSIRIDTNLINYYNDTTIFNLDVLGESEIIISKYPDKSSYNSGESYNISIYYNDILRNQGIPDASLTVQVDGTDYTTNIFDYGNGYYNITVNCGDLIFEGYGWFSLRVDINLPNYYNHTNFMDIKILGLTDYTLLNLTQYGQLVNLNGTTFEAFRGEDLTIYMNFINLFPYSLISGAIGNLTFNGINYLNYSDGFGLYSWEIDTNNLIPGSYSCMIQLNKSYYYNQTILINFDINTINTEITIDSVFDDSGLLDPYFDNGYPIYTSKGDSNVTFIITYWDLNHSYVISGAFGNATVKSKEFLTNYTDINGKAWFTLNSINYEQANFLINVTFWKINYYQYTLWFNLSIVKYETNSSLIAVKQTGGLINSVNNGTHYIIYRNYNSTFLVEYWNEDDNIPIENADVSFILRMGLSTIYTDSSFTNVSGQYEFYIPTYDFLTANYEFTITFSKEDYKTSIIYGNISIVFIPTNGSLYKVTQINHISGLPENLTYYSSNNTFVGLLSYNTTIYFTFWDKLNEEWINFGSNCLLLFDNIYYYNSSTVSNGIYSWKIPTYNKKGTFIIRIEMTKFNWANVSYQFNLTIIPISTTSQIDSPSQGQTYDSNEILFVVLSFNDTLKGTPITDADIQWKVGLGGTYSSVNVTYVSGNYQIELWLRHSEFDGYGPFTIFMMLNKTYYYNQTLQLDFNILGVTMSQLVSPAQDQMYDSDETLVIVLSFDDTLKGTPITDADIQWKVGLGGIYSSVNVTYVSGDYQIELWLRYSEFDGYGPFIIYIMLNKTYYYNQTESLNINILGLTTSQIDSPAQDQTYDSDEILTIVLSFDDSVKNVPIDIADIQWKVGLGGTYSSVNVTYVSGNYQIELWLRHSEFDGYGFYTIYMMLNKTYYYNQTELLNFTILGLTSSQVESPAQDQTYDSNEIVIIVLSFDDIVKNIPIDTASIQWKVGILGTLSNENVSYNAISENFEIELWLRHSEFDGYGPFIIYIELSKTNYHNRTESLNLSILGLTAKYIDHPSPDQTFYSNETLIIELSFDDYIKGIPVNDATIEWKVGMTGIYSNIGVSYPGTGNYEISILLSSPEFDGHGPFTIYISLNKTHYYNQTESLNFILIGLTSINLINITQYNQLISLNGSIYEAQAGENMTVYANFINDYPNKIITGAIGILSFNGEDYVSLGNIDGIYDWEINTNSLPFGLYNFNITFNKIYYENSTKIYQFRVNNLIAIIKTVQKPDSVSQGDSFDISLKLYYELYEEYPINNANISLMVDFGISISFMDAFTNSSGICSFKIDVPKDAIRIIILASYSGNGTYTSASLEITDIELILVEDGIFPLENLLLIIIGVSIGVVLTGVLILRKRKKKKKLLAKDEEPVKPKSVEETKKKIIEASRPPSTEDTKETTNEKPKPASLEINKEKITEESEPISIQDTKVNANETVKPVVTEKKKAKKAKKSKNKNS